MANPSLWLSENGALGSKFFRVGPEKANSEFLEFCFSGSSRRRKVKVGGTISLLVIEDSDLGIPCRGYLINSLYKIISQQFSEK
jgi:hypothetical protein